MLRLAVPGLKDEDITINDASGITLNDFEGMKDADRLTLIESSKSLLLNLKDNTGPTYLLLYKNIR